MNIHSHTILTKLKIPSHAWDEQVAWVKGYILALEDVLGDLDTLLQSMQYGYSADARTALEAAVEQVNETLTQARATLERLKQMEQEAAPTSWKQFSGDLEPENQSTKE